MNDFYNKTKWRKVSKIVRGRDANTCQRCKLYKGKTSVPGKLVHHLYPIQSEKGKGLEYEPTNLVTLCYACHSDMHIYGIEGQLERGKLSKEGEEFARSMTRILKRGEQNG